MGAHHSKGKGLNGLAIHVVYYSIRGNSVPMPVYCMAQYYPYHRNTRRHLCIHLDAGGLAATLRNGMNAVPLPIDCHTRCKAVIFRATDADTQHFKFTHCRVSASGPLTENGGIPGSVHLRLAGAWRGQRLAQKWWQRLCPGAQPGPQAWPQRAALTHPGCVPLLQGTPACILGACRAFTHFTWWQRHMASVARCHTLQDLAPFYQGSSVLML